MNYTDILNSDFFIRTYSEVEEIKKDFPVNHGFIHIRNVLKNAKQISKAFNLTNYEKKLLYIAVCLHDIGYLVDRHNHSKIGGELSKNFLKDKMNSSDIERIATSISNHSGKTLNDIQDDISMCLVVADKLDFVASRYSRDTKKFPEVVPFLKIKKTRIVKNENNIVLEIYVAKNFDEEAFKLLSYYNKLTNLMILLGQKYCCCYDIVFIKLN